MSHVIASIENLLLEKKMKYELRFDAENNRHQIYLNFGGENGRFTLIWNVIHEYSQMMLIGILPINVPELKRNDLIIFLNQQNFSLRIGNFELDPSDGEIRFRYGFNFDPDLPFTDSLGLLCLSVCYSAIDQKLPEIMTQIYGTVQREQPTKSNNPTLPFWCN